MTGKRRVVVGSQELTCESQDGSSGRLRGCTMTEGQFSERSGPQRHKLEYFNNNFEMSFRYMKRHLVYFLVVISEAGNFDTA